MLPQRNLKICFICLGLFGFFSRSLEAASPKNLEDRIKELENANSRLRQEQAMEGEASKLLGQKLLKAYEEKAVIENELKEAGEKIKSLEEELARTRKLMEDEVLAYRRKIGASQEELDNLKKKTALLTNENKAKIYIKELEKENAALKEKLARREEDIARNLSEINRIKEELKARIEAEIVSSAKAEPAVTAPAKSEPTGSEGGGRISRVSKEFNFVIMEFNGLAGVTVGKIFSVYRGEKKIGEVEVTKVRERYVFASVANTIPGEEIKEGDSLK